MINESLSIKIVDFLKNKIIVQVLMLSPFCFNSSIFSVMLDTNSSIIQSQTSTMDLSTVSLLRVRVPVLSLHRTSIPAISSMAVILLVIAPCCDSLWEPIAIVTDNTVGIAIGIPPMRSTKRLSIPFLYARC